MTDRAPKRARLQTLNRDAAANVFSFLPTADIVAVSESSADNANMLDVAKVWDGRQLDLRMPRPLMFLARHPSLRPVTVLVSFEFDFSEMEWQYLDRLRRLVVYGIDPNNALDYGPLWQFVPFNINMEIVAPVKELMYQNLIAFDQDYSVRSLWFSERNLQLFYLNKCNDSEALFDIEGILLTVDSDTPVPNYKRAMPALDTVQIGRGSRTFHGRFSMRYLTNQLASDIDYYAGNLSDLLNSVHLGHPRLQSLQILTDFTEDSLDKASQFKKLKHFEIEIYDVDQLHAVLGLINDEFLQLQSASLLLHSHLVSTDCVQLRFEQLPKLTLTVNSQHRLFKTRQTWPTIKHLHLRLHSQDPVQMEAPFRLSWLAFCVPNLETLVMENYRLQPHTWVAFEENESLARLARLQKLHYIGRNKSDLLPPSSVQYTFEQRALGDPRDVSILTWKRNYF